MALDRKKFNKLSDGFLSVNAQFEKDPNAHLNFLVECWPVPEQWPEGVEVEPSLSDRQHTCSATKEGLEALNNMKEVHRIIYSSPLPYRR